MRSDSRIINRIAQSLVSSDDWFSFRRRFGAGETLEEPTIIAVKWGKIVDSREGMIDAFPSASPNGGVEERGRRIPSSESARSSRAGGDGAAAIGSIDHHRTEPPNLSVI